MTIAENYDRSWYSDTALTGPTAQGLISGQDEPVTRFLASNTDTVRILPMVFSETTEVSHTCRNILIGMSEYGLQPLIKTDESIRMYTKGKRNPIQDVETVDHLPEGANSASLALLRLVLQSTKKRGGVLTCPKQQ
jgi:hypothetical protein